MSKPKKFLIIGRTSSGKSSISKEVASQLGLEVVKSYTTRSKRNSDDNDHIFIKQEEVEQYRNSMIAYTEINGAQYFVTYDMLNKSDIYVIDPKGVKYLKESCPDFEYIEIYIWTPRAIAEIYALDRGDDLKTYNKRYEDENEQFTEYEKKCGFHYHLINNRPFFKSVSKVSEWIQKELQEDC